MKTSLFAFAGFAALVACASQKSEPEAPTAEPAASPAPAPAPPPEAPPAEPEASAAAEQPTEPAEPAGPSKGQAATSGETPWKDAPPDSLLAKLMRSHFEETAEIRAAVIDGNITNAAAPAGLLTNMEGVEKLPVDWKTPVERLMDASARIKRSPDVPEAAAATADIGVACGDCHRKVRGPQIQIGEPPAEGADLASRMKRHAWASERLWEGLYVPSSEAWKAGAQALSTDPFPKDALKKGGVYARSAAQRFVELAAQAGDKKTPTDRANLYANLLATCSSCHTAIEGK